MTIYLRIACFAHSLQMAMSSNFRKLFLTKKSTKPVVISKPWPWYLLFLYKIVKTLLLIIVGFTLAVIYMILRFLITGEV